MITPEIELNFHLRSIPKWYSFHPCKSDNLVFNHTNIINDKNTIYILISYTIMLQKVLCFVWICPVREGVSVWTNHENKTNNTSKVYYYVRMSAVLRTITDDDYYFTSLAVSILRFHHVSPLLTKYHTKTFGLINSNIMQTGHHGKIWCRYCCDWLTYSQNSHLVFKDNNFTVGIDNIYSY